MSQQNKLEKYCKSRLIDFNIDDGILVLSDEAEFEIVESDVLLFDEDMTFLPKLNYDIDGWIYEFGGRWYIQSVGEESVELKEFVYSGNAVQKLPTPSFLGIHSGYELMNGIGLYEDWIKKAKFLGVESLGICERSTLSGVLSFQSLCKRNNIKSIIGMTVPILGTSDFDLKLYVKDFQGWLNLLEINSILNVDKANRVTLEQLSQRSDGLYVVADPKSLKFEHTDNLKEVLDFYQLDPVNYLNEDRDTWYIDNMEKFLKSDLSPISISDAYYLEQEDYVTREALWSIGKAFDDRTDNQYFKNKDQYAKELILMFDKTDKSWISIYKEAVKNESTLVDNCNFTYDTDTRHLPKYEMTEEESSKYDNNSDFFLSLIKKGFADKNFKNPSKYLEQVKKEIEVLKAGDVIDYFLILHDIVRHARSEGMLTGIGRGSAGGSLVAYLLNIIHCDPLEFDLLFERFLNSGRMGKFEDRPFFTFEDDNGNTVELAEGQLAKIIRNGKEKIVYCNEIINGDEIIKY